MPAADWPAAAQLNFFLSTLDFALPSSFLAGPTTTPISPLRLLFSLPFLFFAAIDLVIVALILVPVGFCQVLLFHVLSSTPFCYWKSAPGDAKH